MNEVEFSDFVKRGLGSPASSSPLMGRIAQALRRTDVPGRHTTVRRSFRVTKGLVVLAALVALAAPAAVVATSLLTPHDVAVGMPGGSAIFQGTNPSCVVVTDGVAYRCTLAYAPTVETVPSYLGSKQILQGTDSTIVGGCIGTSSNGLHWDCYIGEAAVQHGILVKSMLGQPMQGPSHG
jgi:hypothetical protein